MAIVVFQHDPHEDSAVLGTILRDCGHRLRVLRLYDSDDVPGDLLDTDAVLSLGGPMNVDQWAAHPWLAEEMAFLKNCYQAGVPIVGICLGAQLLAVALGGEVADAEAREIGWHPVRLGFPGTIDPLYTGIRWESPQFHMHAQFVSVLPPGATPLAASRLCPMQAYRVGLKAYGVQYHFEWTEPHIAAVATTLRAQGDGPSADAALQALGDQYTDYRRVGDRLCRNIGNLLY